MASDSTILGAAGEHYVLFQLLRRGFIAALAPQGVPNCDIIVSDRVGERLCAIQVKTRRDIGSDKGWHMSQKHERLKSENLFYCFLDVGKAPGDSPLCYVVPSAVVAAVLDESHQHWLKTPGKKGQAHNDTKMRRFLPDYTVSGFAKYGDGWLDKFREAWDSLGEARIDDGGINEPV